MRGRPEASPFTAPTMTKEQRDKSDKHAILAMLWLHYAKGWDLARVGSDTIARLVSAHMPEQNIERMLIAAKEIYPRDLVIAWMADQERIGN